MMPLGFRGCRISAAVAGCLGLVCVSLASPARAEVTSVTVDYTAPFGTYGDRTYIYVEATMTGTVDRPDPEADGNYSVGLMMIYPLSGGNGVGLVDWPNSAFFHYYGLEFCPRYMYPLCEGIDGETQHRLEDTVVRFSRLTIEDYMWEQGYSWISVAWDKTVTDMFGPDIQPGRHNRLVYGTIERGTDGDFILQDAARFMRDTGTFEGEDPPPSVDTVISMGYSTSAARQHQFIVQGSNNEGDGSLLYDGFYIQFIGQLCYPLSDEPPFYETVTGSVVRCPSLPNGGDAKIMRITSQSDTDFVLLGAALSRVEGDPNQIQYELPGVPHLSPPVFDVAWVGGTRQNPVDPRPFMRGALRNLTEWVVNGVEPPPSAEIEGTLDEVSGNFTPTVDEDGNALGGTRLPHMPSIIDGQPAGAPTGIYGSLDREGLNPLNAFKLIGGTYERFSDEELMRRYPTPESYRELVTRAADQLLADRYILQEDRDAYVAGVPELPEIPDATDDGGDDGEDGDGTGAFPEDSGCSVGSATSRAPGWSVLFGLLACLPLVRRRARRRPHLTTATPLCR
jgi:hypothetical protein